jgi:hypothetical protein
MPTALLSCVRAVLVERAVRAEPHEHAQTHALADEDVHAQPQGHLRYALSWTYNEVDHISDSMKLANKFQL